MALSERSLKTAKPKKTVYRIRDVSGDAASKGFGATVAPNGSISFFISYTSPTTGRRRQIGLGKYPGVSLKAARERARAARMVVDGGADPVEEKAQKETENLGSVADLFRFYIQNLQMDGKVSAGETARCFEKDIRPIIGAKRVADVGFDDILDVLKVVADRGAFKQANRVRSYLRAAFEFGIHAKGMAQWHGKLPEFGLQFNPVALTKRIVKESVGNRALSRDEVKAVWKGLGAGEVTLHTALAVKFLLASGQRVQEVLHAEWSEFDFDEKIWAMPPDRRGKTRNTESEPHIVPLSKLHIDILKCIKMISGRSKWLFPGRSGRGPRGHGGFNGAVARLCVKLKIVSFTPRDLRRTWKTLAGSIGVDLEIRNRIQGHAMTDVGSRHYDRWGYLPEKRHAMDRWAVWLGELVASSNNEEKIV
ncbi:MAG: integrase arm-type DNA-binding domain-containing protein [Rhodospirillaceae bacterium]|jgi:integrase|nr:integrase arm-type DNA-binding domain-containing protein [Rhodospirillaceae bacterium]MBT5243664.1 integrase arm-type DNA-binding domain-containing protein [Rhodospirillaceae bacterium]MBT5561956.1 integrase arm-type DNA-binding domain-containing protein [Rhodospirillaceae bacterium]MBT6240421.1 integrase arm-type DNA-binding domain-containing protein [Rhodospirillaceae bacterium]MBT7137388.1 integrase arm-type DNA-binding domain-containing protein [Rhodospirillaceae bacterium]